MNSTGQVVKENAESRFLLCVVYSPNTLPLRGADKKIDVASPGVIEEGCWKFALNGLRTGIGHRPGGEGAAQVVENYIHRGPTWKTAGPDGRVQKIRPGDWCVGMILSPAAWDRYKRGEFGGVSLQGRAARKRASAETLARLKG